MNYREGVVRRLLGKLRDDKGTRDHVDFPTTITDKEYGDANGQTSQLGHHIALPKIHKFSWLKGEL